MESSGGIYRTAVGKTESVSMVDRNTPVDIGRGTGWWGSAVKQRDKNEAQKKRHEGRLRKATKSKRHSGIWWGRWEVR